jgi:hypothetical protein
MTIAAGLLVAMLVSLLATLALSAVSAAIRLAAPARVASGPQLGTPSILLRTGIHAGLLVSLALGLATLGARVTLTGHAPWSNLHEFSQAFAVALLGAYLLLARRMPIGGLAYRSALEFEEQLQFVLSHEREREAIGRQGLAYVQREYRWPTVLERVEALLTTVARRP